MNTLWCRPRKHGSWSVSFSSTRVSGVILPCSTSFASSWVVVDHLVIVQSVAGSTAQISNVVQEQTTAQVQIAVDPQSLLDTVKTATRNGKTISITLDDAISTPYTTQTAQN